MARGGSECEWLAKGPLQELVDFVVISFPDQQHKQCAIFNIVDDPVLPRLGTSPRRISLQFYTRQRVGIARQSQDAFRNLS